MSDPTATHRRTSALGGRDLGTLTRTLVGEASSISASLPATVTRGFVFAFPSHLPAIVTSSPESATRGVRLAILGVTAILRRRPVEVVPWAVTRGERL